MVVRTLAALGASFDEELLPTSGEEVPAEFGDTSRRSALRPAEVRAAYIRRVRRTCAGRSESTERLRTAFEPVGAPTERNRGADRVKHQLLVTLPEPLRSGGTRLADRARGVGLERIRRLCLRAHVAQRALTPVAYRCVARAIAPMMPGAHPPSSSRCAKAVCAATCGSALVASAAVS